MKSAKQVREYCRRRCLEERALYLRRKREGRPYFSIAWARSAELAFIEILNAFDTKHKTKLVMPKLPKKGRK